MNISFSQLFKDAFNDTKNNFPVLLGLLLLVFLGSFLVGILVEVVTRFVPAIGFVLNVASNILQAYVTLGMMNICLLIVRGKSYDTQDLFVPFSYVWKYIIAVFIIVMCAIFIALPFILSINLAGIVDYPSFLQALSGISVTSLAILGATLIVFLYFSCRILFYQYLIIESDFSALETITESFQMTKGNVGTVLKFLFLIIALNCLGALCLLVGLLFTLPMTYVLMARLYTIFADATYPETQEEIKEEAPLA